MSAPTTDNTTWLSPTRAWRLAQCPASTGPGVPAVIQADSPPQDTGSLAHRAVELWVRARGHDATDVRAAMKVAIEQTVAEVSSELAPDWTLTGKRLIARAPMLAEGLRADGAEVVPEQTIRDSTLGVYGTPDIVVLGKTTTLIDLKTEQLDDGELSPWIKFQLSLYAHLVQQEHGRLPDRIEVFSTHRGRIPVGLADRDIARAIEALKLARRADPSITNPRADTCRFCRRRLRCEAQWDAASSWEKPDCLAGRVTRSVRSTSGLTGLWLETANGPVLLSEVPTTIVPNIDGETIRAVRVNASPRTEGRQPSWRWGKRSALAVMT